MARAGILVAIYDSSRISSSSSSFPPPPPLGVLLLLLLPPPPWLNGEWRYSTRRHTLEPERPEAA
jgi:hypothetical protein